MRRRLTMLILTFLTSVIAAKSQNESILCTPWCLGANYDFKSEFGSDDCLYVIDITPSNQIIISGWCNSLFGITKSKSVTYSPGGTILEYLIDDNGWIESSFLTGDETRIFNSRENIYPTCAEFAPCNTEIEMVQGVECIMAKIISTGQLLYPLDFSQGVDNEFFSLGLKAKIGYLPVTYPSFCLEGEKQVLITCAENSNSNSDFELCANFDSYSIGPIIPQGSPLFTLFSVVPGQNAQIVTNIASSGNKSLKFISGSNIDFNISRTLTEEQVARVDWKIYIPEGKSGRFGVETNNTSNYAFWVEINNQTLTVWRNLNNIATQISGSYFFPSDKWNQMTIIFQPFDDEIEFWVNYSLIHIVTNYMSNKIEDLNFYTINNLQNTEYYIDDLCYKEWSSSGPCTAVYDPVCIDNNIYQNTCYAGISGYSILEYYPGECGPPACTVLSYPANGALNIPVSLTIQWPKADKVLFYNILVGTSPGIADIADEIVHHSQTSYKLPVLAFGTKIYVTIKSSNGSVTNTCSTTSFTTVSNIQIPDCPVVTYPQNNAFNIPTAINLTWSAVSGVAGYKLRVSYNNGNTVILNNLNVNNITSYQLNNLPNNTRICVRITPFNSAGENLTCAESCFTTISAVQIPGCATVTYPLNNASNIPTSVNLQWTPTSTASGYILRAGTSPGGSDLLNNINIGNVTGYVLNNLPSGRTICFTIIPYNEAGQNLNCANTCFTTSMVSATEDDISKDWIVYPNPTSDYIYIRGIDQGAYTIADITGKIIIKGQISKDPVSLHFLTSGIYVMTLTHPTSHRVIKLEKF